MRVQEAGSNMTYISGAATTQVDKGRGRLRRIAINTPVSAATITVIDGTSGSTANMAIITLTADVKPFYLEYNAIYKTGLRIITSGATDITVVYD